TVDNLNQGGISNAVPFTITAPTLQSAVVADQTMALRGPVGNPERLRVPGTIKSPKFLPRFLGWNTARKEGTDYARHFLRPHAGAALPLASAKADNVTSGPGPGFLAQSLSPNLPPGFQFRPSLTADFLPTSVATGDFNHDGRMDWVVANGGANSLWVYFGNGDGTAQLPVIIPLKGQAPVFVAAADLRGNGTLDLIVAEADSGQVGVLTGNGDGTFGLETSYFVPGAPVSLLIDDFNRDGHKDILVGMGGNVNVGEIALLPGDGAGRFGSPVYRPYEYPFVASEDVLFANNVAEADVNGDGKLDIIGSGVALLDTRIYGDQPGNVVSVLLGDGHGDFSNARVFRGQPSMYSLALADLNGDGKPDVVTANQDADSVSVF